MMSNYPPGVTGNELQIAGPSWEGPMDGLCEATDVTVKAMTSDLWDAIEEVKGKVGLETAKFAEARLLRLIRSEIVVAVDVDVEQCPWEGQVEAWEYDGVRHWECPLCGTEHDEEDEGPDPDLARDLAMEAQNG